VADARPYLFALALEASPLGVVRLARPGWRKSAYVATLLVRRERVEPRWSAASSSEDRASMDRIEAARN
jgi:hypothetical protein